MSASFVRMYYSIFDIYSQKNFLNYSFIIQFSLFKFYKCKNKKWSYFKMFFDFILHQYQAFSLYNSMYFLDEFVSLLPRIQDIFCSAHKTRADLHIAMPSSLKRFRNMTYTQNSIDRIGHLSKATIRAAGY